MWSCGSIMGSDSTVREWLESTRNNGMALGLNTTQSILDELDINLKKTTIIHVAGSNGKGTLCSLLSASLTLNGESNIMFSSPHLCRLEERIRLDGKPVSAEEFDSSLQSVKSAAKNLATVPTFFETTFLSAMVYCDKIKPRFLILETGLGGRLDATRCSPADICVLTSITTEHTNVLGSDIYQIITEKAAIARPGKPIIVRHMEIKSFEETVNYCAESCAIELLDEPKGAAICEFVKIPEDVTALDEAELLANAVFELLTIDTAVISKAKNRLNWPARMQIVEHHSGHRLILDAAHNPSGLARVKSQLIYLAKQHNSADKLCLLFGTSPQEELDKMLSLVREICQNFSFVEICFTKPTGGRYSPIEPEYLASFDWLDFGVTIYPDYQDALATILGNEPADVGNILSIGSLYLQGNILNYLGKNSDDDLSLMPKQSN